MAAIPISQNAIMREIHTGILNPLRVLVTTAGNNWANWTEKWFNSSIIIASAAVTAAAPGITDEQKKLASTAAVNAQATEAASVTEATRLSTAAGPGGVTINRLGILVAIEVRLALGGGVALLPKLLEFIFKHTYITSTSNNLIFDIPKSDEIVNRLLSVLFGKQLGLDIYSDAVRNNIINTDILPNANLAYFTIQPMFPLNHPVNIAADKARGLGGADARSVSNAALDALDSVLSIASSNVWKTMPVSERDIFKAQLNITPQEQAALDKWDERITKIREILSKGPASASAGIDASNIVRQPELNNISQITSLPPQLKSALLIKRASDPSNPISGLTKLRVSMNGGNVMRGGNANPHAPLYPRVVMNGGAHPLATYMGGAAPDVDAPVKALMSRIDGLREQFRSSTGGPSDFPNAAATLRQLDTWKDNVRDGLNSLQENLDRFAKVNAAVSQYRPGLGVDVNAMTDQELKDLVKQADELNKQAQKSAKQFDKLKEISSLLQQLVDKQNAAPVAR